MPAFDVLTIGSATQDVFLLSKKFEEVRNPLAPDGFDACVPLGSKIDMDNVIFTTGGGASNAAVTFAHFGLRTACISRIGMDLSGEIVMDELKKNKIATLGIQRDVKQKTAYSIILISGSGHRAILTYRGASTTIDKKQLPWKKMKTRCLYLTSLAGNMPLLKNIFSHGLRGHCSIAWNPGNREIERGLQALRSFITKTHILILNREEAALLSGQPKRHLSSIFKILGPLPKQALIISDGAHGAYLYTKHEIVFAPALNRKVINTTGAGDALGSAFVALHMKGYPLEDAMRGSMLNATGVISHMGAKAGILKRAPSPRELKRVKLTVPHL